MSKATEMFEELGFDIESQDEQFLEYIGYNETEDGLSIYFDLREQNYCANTIDGNGFEIDIKLHKAITQQMKELGWLDEQTNSN